MYDKQSDYELVSHTPFSFKPEIEYFDINTLSGKKKGNKVKSQWAARMNPFVVLEIDEKPVRVFYTEDFKKGDAIKQLLEYDKDFGNA